MKYTWIYGKWYSFWMHFMEDDCYFCMCGCSPWYWNVKRVIMKFLNKLKIIKDYEK